MLWRLSTSAKRLAKRLRFIMLLFVKLFHMHVQLDICIETGTALVAFVSRGRLCLALDCHRDLMHILRVLIELCLGVECLIAVLALMIFRMRAMWSSMPALDSKVMLQYGHLYLIFSISSGKNNPCNIFSRNYKKSPQNYCLQG